MHGILETILGQLFLGIFLFYPVRKTFIRAGLGANGVFWIFLPVFGLLVVTGILAFSDWPATERDGQK